MMYHPRRVQSSTGKGYTRTMNAAQIIADTITQMAELAREGSISLELHTTVNAALWELATLKDLREEVHNILQATVEAELANLDG